MIAHLRRNTHLTDHRTPNDRNIYAPAQPLCVGLKDSYQANAKSYQATYHHEEPAGQGGWYDQCASSFPSWDNQQIYFNEDDVTDS
eukprot:15257732-Heterocapsa_arctica.AAC.1